MHIYNMANQPIMSRFDDNCEITTIKIMIKINELNYRNGIVNKIYIYACAML